MPKKIDQLKKRFLCNPKIKFFAFSFPTGTPSILSLSDILEENVPEKYFLSRKTEEKILESLRRTQAKDIGSTTQTELPLPRQAMRGGVGAKTGLYAVVDDYNHKLNSPEIIGTVRQTFANQAAGNGQKLMFVDLSTKSSKLTDNARAIQARYNKGYSHHSGEVSGVIQLSELRHTGKLEIKDTAPTLTSQNKSGDTQPLAVQNYRIRRLTCRECERLMSIPDDWTRYGVKPDGTQYELSDSARYKLCGNGVVVNVVREIMTHLNPPGASLRRVGDISIGEN